MGRKTSYGEGSGKILTGGPDKAMDAYSVRLHPYYARMAKEAGCGSFSEGVRVALEQWIARRKALP